MRKVRMDVDSRKRKGRDGIAPVVCRAVDDDVPRPRQSNRFPTSRFCLLRNDGQQPMVQVEEAASALAQVIFCRSVTVSLCYCRASLIRRR